MLFRRCLAYASVAPISNLLRRSNPQCDKETHINTHTTAPCVVVMGAAGIDYIASVDSYPSSDQKIRSRELNRVGGGNAANTATTLSRLGQQVNLISKVGHDGFGTIIIKELQQDGINTDYVMKSSTSNSPFTYVLVDISSNTRTCIHTPMQEDIDDDEANAILKSLVTNSPDWLHFDSRHTSAAVKLATYASQMKIPKSIDIEKFRPSVEELLPQCEVVFTNQHFPALYYESIKGDTCKASLEEQMILLLESSSARMVVTTLGSEGSMLVKRSDDDLSDLRPVCGKPNADGIDLSFISLSTQSSSAFRARSYTIITCPSWKIHPQDIVDTTGAGDSFIGGFIFAFLNNYAEDDCLRIATWVASEKLRGAGSRSTLPTLQRLRDNAKQSTVK